MPEIRESNLVAHNEEDPPVIAHPEPSQRRVSAKKANVAAGPRTKWILRQGLERLVESSSDIWRKAR
jgi:hypothetical protein